MLPFDGRVTVRLRARPRVRRDISRDMVYFFEISWECRRWRTTDKLREKGLLNLSRSMVNESGVFRTTSEFSNGGERQCVMTNRNVDESS
jgi:hypothetical protein